MAPASVGPDIGPPAAPDESLPSAEVSRSELREATFSSLRWVTVARIAAELLSVAAGVFLLRWRALGLTGLRLGLGFAAIGLVVGCVWR